MMHIISLGAGVQSSTMALMAAHGEITPMPNCAIFADTQWEPKRVYEHLDWLCTVLPFPVHRVTGGNIREHMLASSTTSSSRKRFASAPWHIVNPDGSFGLSRRQCTKEFKLEPLAKKQRELAGYKPRQRMPKNTVEVWIGISTDEAMRMKPAWNRWAVNRWPLIEKRMNRGDCLAWLDRNRYPTPPKSSCIGCPFHNATEWREIKKNAIEWQEAVSVDSAIRHAFKMKGTQFMHSSHKPLSEVDLSTPEDRGQLNLFNNECEGMCGV
jgi:hypothetical protein